MSFSLGPDHDQHFISPDVGPNCLQRLSAEDKSPLARKELKAEKLEVIHTSAVDNFLLLFLYIIS